MQLFISALFINIIAMKNRIVFVLIGVLAMLTNTVFSNSIDIEKNKARYKRQRGSTKLLKELNMHTTHDASVKRKYNTSIKPIKLVASTPVVKQNIHNKRINKSIRSFNINTGHKPYVENKKDTNSPFRANKSRR